jgi:hypothetical protein
LFRWDNSNNPNATQLNLEIARDADFGQIFWSLSSIGSGGIQEFRFSENFDPSATIFWRAYLMCGTTQSPYSEAWSFTTSSGGMIMPATSLIAPADDSILSSLPVDLEWSAINGAVEYIVHWTVTGYGGYTYSFTTDTSFTIGWGLDPNTTYDWWITARNDYAWGTDSEKWQFTTPTEMLTIPQKNLNPSFIMNEDGATYKTSE